MNARILPHVILLLTPVSVLSAACGGDSDEGGPTTTAAVSAQSITVTAKDFSFDNVNLAIQAGRPVHLTFKNAGTNEHSFTINGVVDAEAEGGATQTADFTVTRQTTEFHCKYHPSQMKGTVSIGQ